jgi:SNF2 family DNA or RNA helicase
MTAQYQNTGSIISFGENVHFLLTRPMYMAFRAFNDYASTAKCESDNLFLLYQLQQAKKAGANLKLSHFDKLAIHVPDQIAIEAELDSSGNLILTPAMGQNTDHDHLQRVLGQLQQENARTLKVGNEIILFNEKTAKAVKEIISHRVIPKNQVEQFLKSPSAFIDASLVELDVGFSIRVKGATRFKHAYFGETDESGIDWLSDRYQSSKIQPISEIISEVTTQEDLQQLIQLINDAQVTNADTVDFNNKTYDISNEQEVQKVIDKLTKKINNTFDDDIEQEPTTEQSNEETIDHGPIVIDIALNDEELESPSQVVKEALSDVLYSEELDWSNHKRKPLSHQVTGVKWILGLEEMARKKELVNGSLLADDMGLGKTYMALSAIDHYYRICEKFGETCRPTLIVAPLSLLENWKEEIDCTFHQSPFKDIVILQTDGDLNQFRLGGSEIRVNSNDAEFIEPRYSLKVGEKFALERLDLPKRLVLTTYQTLRDYQFSLSLIDWGIVVFDEAQNIKNPNALQTRAAKGLKAKFKLLVTGTPVENSLADFWCLMDTACPGYLNSYQSFRQTYISPILQAASDEVEKCRARNGRKLRENVGALMLRRLKEDNIEGLPNKNIFVGINSSEWKYESNLHAIMQGYQKDVYEGAIQAQIEDKESHMLTTLKRLRDSSLHPRLTEVGRLDVPKSKAELTKLFEESSKLAKTIQVLRDIKARDEKCIIFVINKRLQHFLSIALGKYFELGPLHVINGDTKAIGNTKDLLTRKSMIADFEAKKGFNIIIMSPIAAGVGLTVIGANNVIHYERHWNPAKEAQATDRVYRIGQKKDVNIYIPILHHPEFESFDVNLHKLLSQKNMLKDAVITPGEVMPTPAGCDGETNNPNAIITFDHIKRLSWKQFEALAVELLAKELEADNAWLTIDGADYGADGILTVGDKAILIQAKHKQGSYEGYSAIQEVSNAKTIYSKYIGKNVSDLIFITNAIQLRNKTRKIAKQLEVSIIDGHELAKLCERHKITFTDVFTRLNKQRFIIKYN